MADPAIKLFGRTIPLVEGEPGSFSDSDPISVPAAEEKDTCKEATYVAVNDMELDIPQELEQDDQDNSVGLNNPNENDHQTSSQDVVEKSDSRPEQDQSEANASGQEKVLKKPDKILPCPRCNSLDTKFCYYNNYNVNQPRHFCKNCQRYWTAGGTMRNVPVGAGRRKNKHAESHYRHIMMSSDGLASTREAIDPTHCQIHSCAPALRSLEENGTVLKFGPEAPLCQSMSSVLNLGEQKRTKFSPEEPPCPSSVTASDCVENVFPENVAPKEQNGMQGYCNGFTPMHPLQYYHGPPWAYPWGPGWTNIAAAAAAAMAAGRCSSEAANGPQTGNMGSIQWTPPPILAAPAFCAPIPVPYMPAFWPTGAWNVPWAGSNGGLSPLPSTSTANSGCSGNGSPLLGKHSRDASVQGEKTEKSLWIPKTLRIDDPDDAAKSSIWATLGIKPNEGSMFEAFQSKSKSKGPRSDPSQVLHANPAALSRSQSFRECA